MRVAEAARLHRVEHREAAVLAGRVLADDEAVGRHQDLLPSPLEAAREAVDLRGALPVRELHDLDRPVAAVRADGDGVRAAGHVADVERDLLEAALLVPDAPPRLGFAHVEVEAAEDDRLRRGLLRGGGARPLRVDLGRQVERGPEGVVAEVAVLGVGGPGALRVLPVAVVAAEVEEPAGVHAALREVREGDGDEVLDRAARVARLHGPGAVPGLVLAVGVGAAAVRRAEEVVVLLLLRRAQQHLHGVADADLGRVLEVGRVPDLRGILAEVAEADVEAVVVAREEGLRALERLLALHVEPAGVGRVRLPRGKIDGGPHARGELFHPHGRRALRLLLPAEARGVEVARAPRRRRVAELELEVVEPDAAVVARRISHLELDGAEEARRRHVRRRELVAGPLGRERERAPLGAERHRDLHPGPLRLHPAREHPVGALARRRAPRVERHVRAVRPHREAERLPARVLLRGVHREALRPLLVLRAAVVAPVERAAVAEIGRDAVLVELKAGVHDEVRRRVGVLRERDHDVVDEARGGATRLEDDGRALRPLALLAARRTLLALDPLQDVFLGHGAAPRRLRAGRHDEPAALAADLAVRAPVLGERLARGEVVGEDGDPGRRSGRRGREQDEDRREAGVPERRFHRGGFHRLSAEHPTTPSRGAARYAGA